MVLVFCQLVSPKDFFFILNLSIKINFKYSVSFFFFTFFNYPVCIFFLKILLDYCVHVFQKFVIIGSFVYIGYSPIFDESFEFQINLPELALVRFAVLDDDYIGDEFIGQYTIPFDCMQTGLSS